MVGETIEVCLPGKRAYARCTVAGLGEAAGSYQLLFSEGTPRERLEDWIFDTKKWRVPR